MSISATSSLQRIVGRMPIVYDAVELLVDLGEVAAPVGFARRSDQPRQEHGRRPAFTPRRVHPGLRSSAVDVARS